MTDDRAEIIRRANVARRRGDWYGYFRRLGVAGELGQAKAGPEVRHEADQA
jgi:hypothetical protein